MMLPTESFAEAVAFLRLFDLSALAVSSALCSTLAVKASAKIRCEEFPGLLFLIGKHWIQIISVTSVPYIVANLIFPHEDATAEFLAAACPNCIFKDVTITPFGNTHMLDAIGQVGDSVVVEGTLSLSESISHDDSKKLVRKFRKVKSLCLARVVSDGEVDEIVNFHRESGVQELGYRRSPNYSTLTVHALF